MRLYEVAVPVPVYRKFHYSYKNPVLPGCRVKVPFGKTLRTGYVTGEADTDEPGEIKPIAELIDPEPLLTPALLKLAEDIRSYYAAPPGEVFRVMLPASVKLPSRKLSAPPDQTPPSESGFLLTGRQKEAVSAIEKSLPGGYAGFLLHGDTASGKTEVYMRLAGRLISRSRQLLVLVPEIAITAQLVDRFRARFGSARTALWHSGMTPVRKGALIMKLLKGDVDILIGTRSAVFAPFRDLGGIVIDEEHDPSYKEQSSPYYDARKVAGMRCRIEDAVLVEASATPEVESMHTALSGETELLRLPGKPAPGGRTRVEVVDMRHEKKGFFFSRRLLSALEETLEKKAQAVILINRRGYAPYVVCKTCGENIKCPECSGGLVYHSANRSLLCHFCGFSRALVRKCPLCQGEVFRYSGAGTQRVAAALEKIFPDEKVLRLDSDAAGKSGGERIFRSFLDRRCSILVGTRLVAKGWDFPGVELTGVINAEAGLMVPDFRAPERVYDLLSQLAGRASRGSAAGRLIVQTLNPGHYAVKALLEGDYMSFYEQEIKNREGSGFPPFSRLISLSASGESLPARLGKAAESLSRLRGTEVLGPVRLPGRGGRRRNTWQVLLKTRGEAVRKELLETGARGGLNGIRVNVDPGDIT